MYDEGELGEVDDLLVGGPLTKSLGDPLTMQAATRVAPSTAPLVHAGLSSGVLPGSFSCTISFTSVEIAFNLRVPSQMLSAPL